MTLAVGRTIGRHISLAADWHVTHAWGGAPGYQRGTLKVLIMHPHVAVAYAGNVYAALRALRDFDEIDRSASAVDFLPELLARLRLASDKDGCDCLVGRAGEAPELVRLRDGERLPLATGGQIGNRDAIEAFLAVYKDNESLFDSAWEHGEMDLSDSLQAQRSYQALSDVIGRGLGGPTVGLLAVEARTDDEGQFRYGRCIRVFSTQPQEIVGDPYLRAEAERRNEELMRIDGGSVELHVVPPKDAGVGALAVHFPQHAVGLFAYPIRLGEDLVTYTGVDADAVAERIAAEHGVALDP